MAAAFPLPPKVKRKPRDNRGQRRKEVSDYAMQQMAKAQENSALKEIETPSPSPFPVGQSELTEIGKRLLNDARKAAKGRKGADPLLAKGGFSNEQKAFIVEKFAHFQSLNQVAAALAQQYGITADLRHIEAYDGDSRRCRMGKRLRALFDQCRAEYIASGAKVAVAHQAHRLRLIERTIEKANTAKEFNAVAKLLELAGKETGQLIQHVRHEGTVAHVHGSIDDARAEVAMRLKAMAESIAPPMIDVTPIDPTQGEGASKTGG